MEIVVRYLYLVVFLFVSACSTTPSNVKDMMVELEDPSYAALIKVAVDVKHARTSSQAHSRIFTLHHKGDELKALAEGVAKYYGFSVVPKEEAQFLFEINEAVPDGGACFQGARAVGHNISYSLSVLTFGLAPAVDGHCLFVTASLYRKVAGDFEIVGDFFSNEGKVEVLAGAGEVSNYGLTVEKLDEARGLEVSIAGLFNQMLYEEAFY